MREPLQRPLGPAIAFGAPAHSTYRRGAGINRAEFRLLPCLSGSLFASATLRATYGGPDRLAGSIALGVVFGFSLLGLLISMLTRRHSAPWRGTAIGFAWSALIAICFGGLLQTWSRAGLYQMCQLLLVFCLFAFTSALPWNRTSVSSFAAGFCVTLLVLGTAVRPFEDMNMNNVGAMSFVGFTIGALGFLATNTRSIRGAFLALASPFGAWVVLSQARASWVAAMVFVATFAIYPFLHRPSRFIAWFSIFVAFLMVLTYLSIADARQMSSVTIGLERINDELTGKSLNTRGEAWEPVVRYIAAHPWTGGGLGVSRYSITTDRFGFSSHSAYLDIGLQTGIPGIVALFLVLLAIGLGLAKTTGETHLGRIGCALLMAVVISEGFESSLISGMLPVSVSYWAVLGLCLSLHLRRVDPASSDDVSPRGGLCSSSPERIPL